MPLKSLKSFITPREPRNKRFAFNISCSSTTKLPESEEGVEVEVEDLEEEDLDSFLTRFFKGLFTLEDELDFRLLDDVLEVEEKEDDDVCLLLDELLDLAKERKSERNNEQNHCKTTYRYLLFLVVNF